MDKKSCLLFISFLALIGSVSATQIIVINETREQIYAIDEVILRGDVGENLLKIRGSGEVITGENVRVYLFGPASDVLVRDLTVNDEKTTVSFDDFGYFFIANQGRLKFQGILEIRTIGQIRLFVKGPINVTTNTHKIRR